MATYGVLRLTYSTRSCHWCRMSPVWQCPGCPEPPAWGIDMPALRATFPWLEPLGECPQDAVFHAEGDVLTHLGMVLTELAALPAFRELSEPDRHVLFAGTLLHDISKPECTRTEEDGRVRSPGHAVKGVYKARRILTDDDAFAPLGTPFEVREQVLALVRWHGLPVNYLDKPDPQRAVILTSMICRVRSLLIRTAAICLPSGDQVSPSLDATRGFARTFLPEPSGRIKRMEYSSFVNHP